MPTIQQAWQQFLDGLFEQAYQRFRATPQYRLLQEKVDCCEAQAQTDSPELHSLLNALAQRNGEESAYLYQQGYHDFLTLLRLLTEQA